MMKILFIILRIIILVTLICFLGHKITTQQEQIEQLEKENYALSWLVKDCRGR